MNWPVAYPSLPHPEQTVGMYESLQDEEASGRGEIRWLWQKPDYVSTYWSYVCSIFSVEGLPEDSQGEAGTWLTNTTAM